MNRKNKLSFILLGMIIILPILNTGCFKVGEEDPFLSFSSRKARVAGNWKYDNITSSLRVDSVKINTFDIKTNADAVNWKQEIRIVGTDSLRILNGKVDDLSYFKFEKNGSFRQDYQYVITEVEVIGDDERTKTIRTTIRETSEGNWNFLGRIENDYKNKERITLNYTTVTLAKKVEETITSEDEDTPPKTTILSDDRETNLYANGELCEIWTLVSLKNKEIKMEQSVDRNIMHSNSSTYTEKGTKQQTLKPR